MVRGLSSEQMSLILSILLILAILLGFLHFLFNIIILREAMLSRVQGSLHTAMRGGVLKRLQAALNREPRS